MKRLMTIGLCVLSLNAFGKVTLSENPTIKFTGYKFTEKLGVSGNFKKIEWKVSKSAKSLSELIKGAKVRIDTHSIDAGNEARNMNITEGLFKHWGDRYIEVEFKEVDEKNQTIKAEMEVGSQDEDVYFQYYKNKSGDYVFTGSIDLLQMGFSKAYYALAEICGDMHTGKDGVKKSWPVVDIEVTAKIK